MSTMQTAKGDLLVREAMYFSRDFLGVSGALFYWVDRRRQEMQVLDTLGVPPGFLEQYRRGMQPFDPMCVSRMLERHDSVGVLSIARESQSRAEMRHYQGYLDTYGVLDTVDLMFWGSMRLLAASVFCERWATPRSRSIRQAWRHCSACCRPVSALILMFASCNWSSASMPAA